MKVYLVSDAGGLTEAMVAADTVAAAAEALGMTPRTMRELGWQPLKGPGAAIARKTPGRPYYRTLGRHPGRWNADRAEVLATAARAALRSDHY